MRSRDSARRIAPSTTVLYLASGSTASPAFARSSGPHRRYLCGGQDRGQQRPLGNVVEHYFQKVMLHRFAGAPLAISGAAWRRSTRETTQFLRLESDARESRGAPIRELSESTGGKRCRHGLAPLLEGQRTAGADVTRQLFTSSGKVLARARQELPSIHKLCSAFVTPSTPSSRYATRRSPRATQTRARTTVYDRRDGHRLPLRCRRRRYGRMPSPPAGGVPTRYHPGGSALRAGVLDGYTAGLIGPYGTPLPRGSAVVMPDAVLCCAVLASADLSLCRLAAVAFLLDVALG
jgi:hypothetical protein